MARLAGKAAYITGAGTGIGRETAELFAREGARVTIAELDADSGEATARRIRDAGGQAIAIPTDVREPESIAASIAQAARHWGGLHVLHNNAGGSTLVDSNVVDAPLEEFWRAITLDLYGTFLGCRFGIPEIIKSGGGSVINMTSAVALMGFEGRDCYTAAKGGIAAITRSMAVEYARHKVRVNAIAPSVTLTDRVQRLLGGAPGVAKVADQHLLGLGQPSDVAHAALYFASDESRITTGSILPIDSGVVAA